MTEKLISICSDDFGQNQSIDEGILKLVSLGRLQAVTVFTEGQGWALRASKLKAFESQIDIGIHLNLTEPFVGSEQKSSLNSLLLRSHLRLLNKEAIKNSFRQQIQLFKSQMNRLPDFLDGHQHVHAFPIINQALQEVIQEFWGENSPLYVRDSSKLNLQSDGFLLKKIILHIACRGLTAKMNKIHVTTNSAFTGVYDFAPKANYANLVQGWLKSAANHTLMMCHPACNPKSDKDPLHEARVNEFNYLSSDAFLADCRQLGVKLIKYSNLHSNAKVSN